MPLRLNLEIPNNAIRLFVCFAVIAFIAGAAAYTFNPGSVPPAGQVVGHALSTIQGYFQGDASLEQSLGKFCQSDGTNCAGGAGAAMFDSGWFPANANGVYTLNHNLGTQAIFIEILWAPDLGGNPNLSKVARVETVRWGAGALEMGAQVLEITNSTMKVYLADSYLSDALYTGGYAPNTGHYRVLASTYAGGVPLPSIECDWDGIKAISGAGGPEDDGCFCCRDNKLKWMRMVPGNLCASQVGC